MQMQNIVIYALIGAICVAVVTGGYISMTQEEEPTSSQLLAGVAAGGALGSAVSYFSSMPSLTFPMIGGGGDISEMKVGLPTF
jgi:hypothetical protein